MMVVQGGIVDEKLRLVGLRINGSSILLNQLAQVGFNNNQLAVLSNGAIKEVGRFKLNKLPMLMYNTNNGNMNVIPNSAIEAIRQIYKGNKLVGYAVDVPDLNGRAVKAFSLDGLAKLATWFKPVNFVVRHMDHRIIIASLPDSANVKKLAELPITQMTEQNTDKQAEAVKKEAPKKEVPKQEAAKPVQKQSSSVPSVKSLLQLYEAVNQMGGIVINLPSEKYHKHTESDVRASSEFMSLGIGEIASPEIVPTETNLNVNLRFKKLGTVMVNMNNMPTPIYTFTWTTKTVVLEGKNNIKRLGLGVKEEYVSKLVELVGDSNMKEITSTKVITPIRSVTGAKDLRVFEINTNTFPVMSKAEAGSRMSDIKTICDSVHGLTELKLYSKEINKGIKAYKSGKIKNKKNLFGLFANMDDEALQCIREAGIDIFTGAFTKTEKIEDSDDDNKEKKSKGVVKEDIEVKMDTLRAPKDLKSILGSNSALYPEYAVMISDIEARKKELANNTDAVGELYELYEKAKISVDKKQTAIKKVLWRYKIAMLNLGSSGNERSILINGRDWAPDENTRVKKYRVYADTIGEGVRLKVANIESVKIG